MRWKSALTGALNRFWRPQTNSDECCGHLSATCKPAKNAKPYSLLPTPYSLLPAHMKSIDFLPDSYRQRDALRRARLWWGIVVVIFGAAIGASAVAQTWLRHGLAQQLDALGPEYALAQAQVQDLSTLQSQIARAGHEASLYTFLENPWPRTQLLAEAVRPLPDTIRLTKISVIEEEQAKMAIQVGPRNTKAEEEA